MAIIQQEIEAREISLRNVTEEKRKTPMKQGPMSPQGTTKAFVMKQGKAKRSVHCYFCKKEHFAEQCHEVKDNKRRANILTNAKRCVNCLKIGHTVATCYSKRRCKHCNGKHHPAVCSAPAETENQPISENPITTSVAKGKTNVLLQTALAYAFGEDQSKKVPVNILFDSGSQRSYITKELQRKLSLKSSGSETLNLNTFGSEKSFRKRCDRVIVNLEAHDECIPITALSSRAICSPLASCVDVRNYLHLEGLDIANREEC